MKPLTVIIPSRSGGNLVRCVEAVRQNEPEAVIVVVDDGISFGADGVAGREWIRTQKPIYFIVGVKPFIFSRNINLGIAAATSKGYPFPDVVLLNDDALLESRGGFEAMRSAAARPRIAIVSSTTNIAANVAQYPRAGSNTFRMAGPTPGFGFPAVAFVCVLIPGRTLETVGFLDERFTAYGWEDVDYCRRIRDAGQQVAIDDRCFVDHSKMTSSFRGNPRAPGAIDAGRAIYIEKWGKL